MFLKISGLEEKNPKKPLKCSKMFCEREYPPASMTGKPAVALHGAVLL